MKSFENTWIAQVKAKKERTLEEVREACKAPYPYSDGFPIEDDMEISEQEYEESDNDPELDRDDRDDGIVFELEGLV